MDIQKLLKERILFFDGALGTMLQNNGLPTGEIPELYNLSHPEVVRAIHKEYVDAGADFISTNTFQANSLKIPTEYSVTELIDKGVLLAKESGAPYVALSVGPLGQLLEPIGTVSFNKAYDVFKEVLVQGEKSGADCILFETFSDLLEAKIAILAARENTNLPVLCTMTYQEDGRTFVGTDPINATLTLQGLGIDAIGVNCSLGPKELIPTIDHILEYAKIPVMVQANAGLPQMENGKTIYTITAEEFTEYEVLMAKKGVKILGGCCGTTPAFIQQLKENLADFSPIKTNPKNITAITSATHIVDLEKQIAVIGERINPTGKKKLQAALRENQMDYLLKEALDQTAVGANILDVNVGLPEIDEPKMLSQAIKEIQGVSPLPLQIDSADPTAIEAAVRVYAGKPLINSVNGKAENMEVIFPIVKKYGAVVVGLTLDENGIPKTAEERFLIAEKIVKKATEYGIPKEDILIDCLVLTASAQQEEVRETLKAVQMVSKQLGLKTVLGVSNVSFGLPQREILNATFLAAAFGCGLNAPILNPLSKKYMEVVDAYRVLNNEDLQAEHYISRYSGVAQSATPPNESVANRNLHQIIVEGRRNESAALVKELLTHMTPLEIIDAYFIPALDEVGKNYENGSIFLPQLMQSAESVKNGFSVIKEHMDQSDEKTVSRGKILLATVKGDIHDIGKNIVRMMLENYGFTVYDLGKDVPIEKVVEVAKNEKIQLIGLSALMTTTVQNMKETIAAVKEAHLPCSFMVGGAVLNEEYTQFVGADFYAKDAMESVSIATAFFKEHPDQ